MSLFKRKQSKEKETTPEMGSSPMVGGSPQHLSRSSMAAPPNSRMPGPGPNGTGPGMGMGMGMNGPPMANGPSTRRNTSNPVQMMQHTNGAPGGPGPSGPGGYRQDQGHGGFPQPPHSAAPTGAGGAPMGMRSATAPVQMGGPPNGQGGMGQAPPASLIPGQGGPGAAAGPGPGSDLVKAPVQHSLPAPGTTAPNPNVSYPWSIRPLRLFPPLNSPQTPPINPFPRYGLAVPAFPSHSGHMLVFGGLVHENTQNDLWSMDVRDCSTMQVQTRGQVPSPRVGHAAAMADRIMLMWGGDTKLRVEDKQDESLYLLDLRSQEWTSVPVQPGPVGRYGHAVCLLDSKFYIFGGQAEGRFKNDLWSYDIRQGSGDKHVWQEAEYKTPGPSPRTGHVLLSAGGVLYVFGGTDGDYHYNDTWRYDPRTAEWTELSCIGYIPVPREGHAAAMVEDTIYVFGGRDVNGKDLGDLAAFRISTSRWFMFQNMGPSPSPRSGHAMVAAHGKIFILGGEANASNGAVRDDPSVVHVLDTVKIKYPADNSTPRTVRSASEKSGYLVHDSPSKAPGDARRIQASISTDNVARAASPLNQNASPSIAQTSSAPIAPPIETRGMPRSESIPAHPAQTQSPQVQQVPSPPQPSQPLPQEAPVSHAPPPISAVAPNGPSAARANGPPQRPRREGDEEYRRAMSPPNAPASPTNTTHNRVTSPVNVNGPASPPQQLRNGFNPSLVGTRSPSPRLRNVDGMDRAAPPPDAFYYGRSPTNANGFVGSGTGRPGSVSSGADLVNQLRGKDGELDAARKREVAMKVILARAVKQGFVLDDEDEGDIGGIEDGVADEKQKAVVQKLAGALMRMKQEKASLQTDLLAQLRQSADKASEAERLRKGALQEAAFYRAKIATLESASFSDLSRIEKERIADLERQLGTLASEHGQMQREVERTRDAGTSDKALYEAALEREAESAQRAEDAEEAHRVTQEELEELRATTSTLESSLREQTERMITLNSTVQQRESERDHYQSRIDDAHAEKEKHMSMIDQVQAAIAAAGVRSAEVEESYRKATERISELEADLLEARQEAEARGRDADLAAERYAEVERAYTTSREEADSLRTATSGKLGELLDSHRDLLTNDARGGKMYQDQVRALEEEGKSLRKMLREAGQRLEDAEAGVSHHRSKTRDLENAHKALKGELRSARAKHVQVQQDLARNRELHATREGELRDRDAAVTEIETRCTVLRNILAEHGIAVADSDLDSAQVPTTSELEKQLRDRTRAYETSQREVEELSRRCAQAEDQVESLGRLVERIKDARSPTSMSMRSPSPSADAGMRAADAERKMAEMENQHKEKMAALEGDYQTAVRYVKGTEKMLKRMKDELNKQKTANTSLQTEIDQLRGRPSEAGARTRDASGRTTPGGDGEMSRRYATLQSQHSALQAELQASRDVLNAREREVDIMRMRVETAEREVENLRDELAQAQHRITTLLEMGGGHGFGLDDNEDMRSEDGSEEASMAFDKFTKELKQWERSRSPTGVNGRDGSDDDHPMPKISSAHLGPSQGSSSSASQGAKGGKAHKRSSSDYSGQWAQ